MFLHSRAGPSLLRTSRSLPQQVYNLWPLLFAAADESILGCLGWFCGLLPSRWMLLALRRLNSKRTRVDRTVLFDCFGMWGVFWSCLFVDCCWLWLALVVLGCCLTIYVATFVIGWVLAGLNLNRCSWLNNLFFLFDASDSYWLCFAVVGLCD